MESPLIKFNQLIDATPKQNTLSYIHNTFGKLGVKVSYEKAKGFTEDAPSYDRFMFGTFVRSSKFWFPGIIIATADGKSTRPFNVVSVPCAPPVSQYKTATLYAHWPSDVKVTNANDGTTVTLYYFNGKWVISTYRGYQVNDFVWAAKKTYQEVVDEVLSNYPFKYENLNKKHSYSFGFNHHCFHPFQSEKKEMVAWFIQSVDLDKFNSGDQNYISYDNDIGLPLQKTQTFSTLRAVFDSAKNAYAEYEKDKVVNYGYLVKVGARQFLIESSLLKHIRHIFYSNRFNNLDPVFDKNKYIMTYSFLDAEKHDVFKTLFPQFNDEFIHLENVMSTLISTIYKMSTSDFKATTTPDVIAQELTQQIAKLVTLKTKKKKNAISILYSYIYNTMYTSMLYNLAFG
jgi:hypothetical protein